jgi:hypothetical protein
MVAKKKKGAASLEATTTITTKQIDQNKDKFLHACMAWTWLPLLLPWNEKDLQLTSTAHSLMAFGNPGLTQQHKQARS